MAEHWVERWRDVILEPPKMPGVWRRKAAGFRIRGRARDPRTGRRREVNKALPDCTSARAAYKALQKELQDIRDGVATASSSALPLFKDYAATVFERRLAGSGKRGGIKSAKSREKWRDHLNNHLIPAFGHLYVDRLRYADVEAFKAKMGREKVSRPNPDGEGRIMVPLSPKTINGWLSTLRSILADAAKEYHLTAPAIDLLDTTTHRTYTHEAPNSLVAADVSRFLAAVKRDYPQHYAFVLLGFVTGLRPSSLRPLRRTGKSADIKWDENLLLVRRSHTRHAEVMDATKTARDQAIRLPAELVEELRAHVATLSPEQLRCGLLFPSAIGGFRSASCLDKPFQRVSKALNLPYSVTPRAMRRTYQDLARAAGVHDVVTRAISGHVTETMQQHYSTASDSEIETALAKVIDIATGKAQSPHPDHTPANHKRSRSATERSG